MTDFLGESVTEKRKRGQSTGRTTAPEAKHASRDNNQQASTGRIAARPSWYYMKLSVVPFTVKVIEDRAAWPFASTV
jgi:hypothetical protein